jgi:hypothetical protein
MSQPSSITIRRVKGRKFASAVASSVALSVSLVFSGPAAADQCTPVSGNFALTPPPPPPCTTGILCLQGAFSGSLSGTSSSSLMGFQPVPNRTDAFIFTATSTLTVPGGTVTTTDIGVGTNCLTGPISCTSSNEVLTITSGTGAYANAYGAIFLTGAYITGQPSAYQGQICIGKPKRGHD